MEDEDEDERSNDDGVDGLRVRFIVGIDWDSTRVRGGDTPGGDCNCLRYSSLF